MSNDIDYGGKLTDEDVPARSQPRYILTANTRVVRLGDLTVEVPLDWTYHQYLMLGFLGAIMDGVRLTSDDNSSVFSKLYVKHIEKNMHSNSQPYRMTHGDVYLVSIASDLELLQSDNNLPEKIVKRLKSESDGEVRGAIYEVSLAAGFIRAGYDIGWIDFDSSPEFHATKGNITVDVEGKRRDRSENLGTTIEQNVRAIKKNITKAMKKHHRKRYLIFIDTDFPPMSSKRNKQLYDKLAEELGQSSYQGVAVILTNSGYEHENDNIDKGQNSMMVIQGSGSLPADYIKELLTSIFARLPDAIWHEQSKAK